jgi:hypothetical protein
VLIRRFFQFTRTNSLRKLPHEFLLVSRGTPVLMSAGLQKTTGNENW